MVCPVAGRDPGACTGYRGTADAVYRNLEILEREGSRIVLVLAGDHVYRMDYRKMLASHQWTGADVTVDCVEVRAAEAHRYDILQVDAKGRIERFVEKPQTPEALPSGERSRESSCSISTLW
jgi:glucose-1-phosphate adenylyltransferase